MTSRRTAICLIAMGISMGISAIASIGSAAAQNYPTRPVKWVVGYPPGGATDIIARLIGQRMSERLGQQFVIENKPGAGNNIATESVINAEPDGYTVLLVNPANYINAIALHQPEIQRGSRHRAGRGVQSRAQRHDGQQGRAGQDGRRVHRLCEGRSRQGESGVVGQRHLGASVRRNVHDDVGRSRCSTCPTGARRPRSPTCSAARSS